MKKLLAAPSVGWWAILSGAVAIVGDIFLILFYIFQAPRLFEAGGNAPDYLGRVNDAAVGIQALLLIPIALTLLRTLRHRGSVSAWQRVVEAVAMISMVIIGCIQLLYALHMIGFETQTGFMLPAWGIIGLWMILTHYQTHIHNIFSRSLAKLGIAVGAAFFVFFLSVFAIGGAVFTAGTDPSAFFSNTPFLIAMGISLLIGFFGFFAFPVWAIWLGRVILSGKTGTTS